MRVNIGPYLTWWGPYQIADLLQYVGVSEDKCHEVGKWLDSHGLGNICQYIYAKRKRTVNIKLERYDTYNADTTLALIILPMLKQLKATKQGAPSVKYTDVPERLIPSVKPTDGDVDDKWFARWDWVLDEMIWAFEQKQPDNDWESAYHHGVIDWNFEGDTMKYGDKHTHSFDNEGWHRHHNRMANGFRLFGKYFEGLWS